MTKKEFGLLGIAFFANWISIYLGILVVGVIILSKSSVPKKKRRLIFFVSLFCCLKIGAFVLYHHMFKRSIPSMITANPPIWLGSDGPGLKERIVFTLVYDLKNRSGNIDPFSTSTLKFTSDGKKYSIGPDRIDGGLLCHYDPTNGILSSGDIPLD